MAKLSQQLRLRGGRLLAYDEYCAPDGTPIIYFYGSPSSRLEWGLFGGEMLANRLNIWVAEYAKLPSSPSVAYLPTVGPLARSPADHSATSD